MTTPLISVIVPSYNKVKYIGKTLDSIFTQNYPNLEVIVQDGGSTDGTLDIIKKYKVILESKKDKGQLDAINLGMLKAHGEILTFINADDYYEADTFKLISDAYVKNPNAKWFVGQGRVVNERNVEIAKLFTLYKNIFLFLNRKLFLLLTNYIIQPSVFFTKTTYNKFGPFVGTAKFVLEYDFWLKLSKIEMPVVINKPLSNFRLEKDTKTMTMFDSILGEDTKLVKKYTSNPLILILHDLHNQFRRIIGKFI